MSPDQEVELAVTVMSALEKLVENWKAAKAGQIDPQTLIDHATEFSKTLAANNAAADSALDKRFPK